MGTYLSSAMCSSCKTGYITRSGESEWICKDCAEQFSYPDIANKVQCCSDKLKHISMFNDFSMRLYMLLERTKR